MGERDAEQGWQDAQAATGAFGADYVNAQLMEAQQSGAQAAAEAAAALAGQAHQMQHQAFLAAQGTVKAPADSVPPPQAASNIMYRRFVAAATVPLPSPMTGRAIATILRRVAEMIAAPYGYREAVADFHEEEAKRYPSISDQSKFVTPKPYVYEEPFYDDGDFIRLGIEKALHANVSYHDTAYGRYRLGQSEGVLVHPIGDDRFRVDGEYGMVRVITRFDFWDVRVRPEGYFTPSKSERRIAGVKAIAGLLDEAFKAASQTAEAGGAPQS
jgi:hypothetical protein